MTNHWSNVS